MCKDGAVFTKGKIKGEVNYPPFEKLDEETLREVQKFQVYPVGKITEFARHIPYNSEKKSFLEKTGRESFEGKSYFTADPWCLLTCQLQFSNTLLKFLETRKTTL